MLYSDVKPGTPVAEYDVALLWVIMILLGIGLVMVYSASIAIAEFSRSTGHQPMYFLFHQAAFLFVGLVFAVFVFQVPSRVLQRCAPYLFLVGILLLVLVLIPGIGHVVNGSRRWIPLVVVNLQPSEFMKVFVLLYAADYTVRKAGLMHSLKRGFMPMLAVMLVTGGLLLLEPDFGSFAVITVIAMGILFLGGMNWRPFAGLLVMLVVAFVLLIRFSPYRMQRVVGFMHPWSDPYGRGYQLSHALIAFGRGEWFGVGLGASVEKLFYLPEAYSDFLLAVIAEELGFVGVAVITVLFAWFIVRAFSIGRRAAMLDRPFAALVAQGIGLWVGVQVIINMGVNMGVLPTKGLTLPLLSYGGSGLVTTCGVLAALLRIDWENRQAMRGLKV